MSDVREAEEKLLIATRTLATVQLRAQRLRDRIKLLKTELDEIMGEQQIAENSVRNAFEKLQTAHLQAASTPPLGIEE
jgi:hypothetical protein